MCQKVVIPAMVPGSRPFNKSCKPYLNLDYRFIMRCPGMTKRGFTLCRHSELVSESSKKGFTLIELLVVVLIIGILSAVALPQYQKAVYKSRMTEGFFVMRSIVTAEEAYYMANGSYTGNFEDLDIQYPELDHFAVQFIALATTTIRGLVWILLLRPCLWSIRCTASIRAISASIIAGLLLTTQPPENYVPDSVNSATKTVPSFII